MENNKIKNLFQCQEGRRFARDWVMTLFLLIFVVIILSRLFSIKPVFAAENDIAKLKIITKDAGGANFLQDIKFEVYLKDKDADGRRVLGKKIKSGTTGTAAIETLEIDLEKYKNKVFVVKLYTLNPEIGAIYYWNIYLSAGETYTLKANLSSLKIVLKSQQGEILKNKKFNLYTQNYNLDGQAYPDQIYKKGLSTGEKGSQEVIIGPGRYVLEVEMDKRQYLRKLDIEVKKEQRRVIEYVLNNLTVSVRDKDGFLLTNQKFEVYKQPQGIGNLMLGDKIGSYNTGPEGSKTIYLPFGVYSIKFLAEKQN